MPRRRNYHKILGLEEGATLIEIKKAYRSKAKMYHPDRNKHPRAEEAFILVNEAYIMLSNPPAKDEEIDHEKRKKYYGTSSAGFQTSTERHQEAARKRAREYAQTSYEEFVNSKIYKTAMVVNKVYNYIFLICGFLIILGPILGTNFFTEEQEDKSNYFTIIMSMLMGVGFTYGVWYFSFKIKEM